MISATAPVVAIRDLRYRFPGSDQDVLRIPQLDIWSPGLTAITGPSGAGKSTLVEILAGTLREPFDGQVVVLGHDLARLERDADRQRHIRRIGLIPQDFGLMPRWTVRRILEQDLIDAGVPRHEIGQRIERALLQVDLLEFVDRTSVMLSGGQRQRVAIARMLARDVELVIADEPTANLDPTLVGSVIELFRGLAATRAVLIVTHDPTVAALCDRTIVLQSAAGAPANAWSPRRRRTVVWGTAIGLLGTAIVAAIVLLATRSSSPEGQDQSLVPASSANGGNAATSSSSAPQPSASVGPCGGTDSDYLQAISAVEAKGYQLVCKQAWGDGLTLHALIGTSSASGTAQEEPFFFVGGKMLPEGKPPPPGELTVVGHTDLVFTLHDVTASQGVLTFRYEWQAASGQFTEAEYVVPPETCGQVIIADDGNAYPIMCPDGKPSASADLFFRGFSPPISVLTLGPEASLPDVEQAICHGHTAGTVPVEQSAIEIAQAEENWQFGPNFSEDVMNSRLPCLGPAIGGLAIPLQVSPANGTVFGNDPRTTTISWNSVPGAASYGVAVDSYPEGTTDCNSSSGESYILATTEGTSYTFNFVGAQPGCWRVWAIGPDGDPAESSPWWEFSYTV